MPRDVLINVNFPDCPPDEVKGIAVTAQGRRRQERLHIDERQDGRGNPYYWIAYVRQNVAKAADGTDLAALDDRRIAVTPLKLDMTDEPTMTRLAKLFELKAVSDAGRLWRRRPASACASASTWNGFCSVGLRAIGFRHAALRRSRSRTRTAPRAGPEFRPPA